MSSQRPPNNSQADVVVSLLRQIATNTSRNNASSSSNRQSSGQSNTTMQAAAVGLDPDAINSTTAALNSQTDAVNSHTDSINSMSDAVQNSLNYSEKLEEMAQKSGSTLIAYGKIIDDVFGGKIGKVAKSVTGFLGKIGNAGKTMKNIGADWKKLKDNLEGASRLKVLGAKAHFAFSKLHAVLGPVGMAIKVVGGVMINVFVQTMKMAAKLTKFFVALPLTMASAAAKIGNSIRQDISETIANAVEETQTLFDMSEKLGGRIGIATQGLADFAMQAKTLHAFKNVTSDFVKLFGAGASGVTKMISEYTKMLTDAGVFADIFAESISKITKGSGPKNLILLTKATQSLGMSTQDFGYVALESAKNGESLYKSLDDIMTAVNTTAKEFGLNSKLISKNFFVLRNDIVNFGHLTNEQLTETVGKITQMGISVKEASSMFNKFGTFEDAAQSAALLSQTFGMNVDALQLIRAEKPEEIIEMFSDAMFATGRSFDELNRHEKAVMAQYTGLSAEALKSVMNYKTMGMTYAEIQKKMAEEDPTVQQRKNIEAMTSSLREMQKVITDTSFIESFKRGLTATITLASGLDPIFTRISKRMQEFYISGLELPEDVKNSIKGMFSPITETFEKLIGVEGSETKGIFNKKKFTNLAKEFTNFIGKDLERAFNSNDSDKKLTDIQEKFTNKFTNSFSNFLKKPQSTTAGKLMQASGVLIGKFLKGFAAIGPGLIKTLGGAFRDMVNWLQGYGGEQNSINKIFTDFFKLKPDDQKAIKKTFYTLVEEIGNASGPLWDIFMWVNKKILGLAYDIGSIIAGAIYNALPDTLKTDSKVATTSYQTSIRTGVDNSTAMDALSVLKKRDNDTDEAFAGGQLLAYLERQSKSKNKDIANAAKEALAFKYSVNDNDIPQTLEEIIKSGNIVSDFLEQSTGRQAEKVIENAINKINTVRAVRNNKDKISFEKNSNNKFAYDPVTVVGVGGASSSLRPSNDLLFNSKAAAKANTTVHVVKKLTNEVTTLISEARNLFSGDANKSNQSSNQPLPPIIIHNRMDVDGKTVATAAVKADIVGLMNNPNLGGAYSTLSDGTISNPSFGSTQGTSV